MSELKSTREGFGEAILDIARNDPRVVVLTADLGESMHLGEFARQFPERFFECGVAEQNMMGVAAGMAISGKIPFVCSFAVFSPTRAIDQLRVSICYPKLPVKIIGGHTGIITGEDGASHQALEDIALMRVMPSMTVLVPADYNETKKQVLESVKIDGPVYIRLTRPKTALFSDSDFKKGSSVTVISCGPILENVIKACEGIDAEIINLSTLKPINKEIITNSAKKTGKVVTVEDHQIYGGLGSAVSEVLSQNYPVPLKIIGINDTFGESGKPEELLEKYGLGVENIRKEIWSILQK